MNGGNYAAQYPANELWPDERGGATQTEEEALRQVRKLTWFSRKDLDNIPRQKFLPGLEGLLVKNTLAVIFGPPGSGKSFCAIDWAARLCTQGLGVVYVAAEGAEGIRPRLVAWERAYSEGRQLINFVLIPETANLLSRDDSQSLLNAVRDAIALRAAEQDETTGIGGMPALIVVDTLARSMPGGNENDQQDIGLLIDNCEQIRALTGACVLLVHHTNKAGFLRGSTVIPASMETIVELRPSDDKALITMHLEKQKNHAELPDVLYRLQDDAWTEIDPEDDEDIEMTSCVFVLAEAGIEATRSGVTPQQLAVMKVLAMPAIGPAVSLAMIIEHSGANRTNTINKLNELMKKAAPLVAKAGHGKYQLTEDGKRILDYIEASNG
jgi:AAA domain